MSIEKQREKVVESILVAMNDSQVDLGDISAADRETLAAEIADRVMVAIDDMLDENLVPGAGSETDDGQEEVLLWQGRPFLSIVERYLLTSERLKITSGFFSRDVENFELIRFQDIDYKQGMTERVLGIGDITIRGHDVSDPKIVLRNIKDPEQVYEILRKAWLEARKRHGLEFREFM